MKKIGIILPSPRLCVYSDKLITQLISDPRVDITFLLINNKKQKSSNKKSLLTSLEYLALKLLKKSARHFSTYPLSIKEKLNAQTVTVSQTSNLEHLEQVDLLVDLSNQDDVLDSLLKISKDGCLSANFNIANTNNNWAGFYNVTNSQVATPLEIFHKTLLKGNIATKLILSAEQLTAPLFLINQIRLFNSAYYYLNKVISSYIQHDKVIIHNQLCSVKNLKLATPSCFTKLKYTYSIIKHGFIFSKAKLRTDTFFVAYTNTDWPNAKLSKGTIIKNQPNHYFADPFVMEHDNRTICFVENYSFAEKKGKLAAIEIFDNDRHEFLGDIIIEPFHLSFPYIFKFQGQIYMVPESNQANEIRLYKCINFPLHWEYQHNLMDNCKACDNIIFEHEKKWWLLSNIPENHPSQMNTNLNIFYSDSPISNNWVAHKSNPVLISCNHGRNGGILFNNNGLPARVRQRYGFLSYGIGYSIAQICEMSTDHYSEKMMLDIKPNFFKNIKGCHHMHSNAKYTVYDCKQ